VGGPEAALKKPKAAASSSELSGNDKTEDAETNVENGEKRQAVDKPATISTDKPPPPTAGGGKPVLVNEKTNGLASLLGHYGSDSDDTD
jgi:hypothetical protein